MGLKIQPKLFGYKLAAFMAVFALAVQPLYGAVSAQIAHAATKSVEMTYFNTQGMPLSAAAIFFGMKFNGFTNPKAVDVYVERTDGRTVLQSLKSSVATTLGSGVTGYIYTKEAPGSGEYDNFKPAKSWERSKYANGDPGYVQWTADTRPTKAWAVVTASDNEPLTSEKLNFSDTVSIPYAHPILDDSNVKADAYYASGTGYTDIKVDTTLTGINAATDVELCIDNGDGVTFDYCIHAKQSVLDDLNDSNVVEGGVTRSGPIVISGNRTSDSWTNQNGTWTSAERPSKARVVVTLQDGTKLTAIDDTIVNSGVNTEASVFADVYTTSTEVVTGDTAAGYDQPGWMFNRDQDTKTPFEFNTNAFSLGAGSLYVKPIGSNPSDKFIAENFINSPIADIKNVSYDFKIGNGGTAADANEFYMSVYANFGESDNFKFYDCRYSVVPTIGSTAGFTTVTFDPTQPYAVTKSGSSPHNCPAAPADMNILSSGSTIRAFAINVGDTGANDIGLDGYLDNVKVRTAGVLTVYDFERDTTPPAAPTGLHRVAKNGGAVLACSVVTQRQILYPTWDANTEADFAHYEYTSINANGSIGINAQVLTTNQFVHNWTPPTDGTSGFKVRAVDTTGNKSAWSDVCQVTYDSTAPAAPVINTPTQDAYFTNNTILNSWSPVVDVNSGVNRYEIAYKYDDGHNFAAGNSAWTTIPNIDGSTSGVTRYTSTGTNTQRTHTPNINSEQGGVTIWVRAVDNAGNVSAWSTSRHYTLDSIKPVVAITSSPKGNVDGTLSYNVSQNVKISLTEANPGVTKVYKDGDIEVQSYDAAKGDAFALNSGLKEGKYYIVHTDKAGQSSDPVYFVVSRTSAKISNVTGLSASGFAKLGVNKDNTITFTVDKNGGSDIDEVLVRVKTYDATKGNNWGATQLGQTALGNTEGDYTFDLTNLLTNKMTDGGKYVILLQARNAAGVHEQQYYDLVVDNTAPEVNITDYSQNGNVIQPNVTVVGDDIVGRSWTTQAGVTVSNPNVLNPTFTVTTDGTYTFHLTVTDDAGNSTTVPFSFTYTTPPAPQTTGGGDAGNQFSGVSTAAPAPGGGVPIVTPLNDDGGEPNDPEVLGVQDNAANALNKSSQSDKLAATATPDVMGASDSKFLGLVWYWWLLIAAGVIGTGWWIAAAARRRREGDDA